MRRGTQALRSEFGRPGASIAVKQQCIDGEYAYLVWTADAPDNVYEIGSDTFRVKGGKIVAQPRPGIGPYSIVGQRVRPGET